MPRKGTKSKQNAASRLSAETKQKSNAEAEEFRDPGFELRYVFII